MLALPPTTCFGAFESESIGAWLTEFSAVLGPVVSPTKKLQFFDHTVLSRLPSLPVLLLITSWPDPESAAGSGSSTSSTSISHSLFKATSTFLPLSSASSIIGSGLSSTK